MYLLSSIDVHEGVSCVVWSDSHAVDGSLVTVAVNSLTPSVLINVDQFLTSAEATFGSFISRVFYTDPVLSVHPQIRTGQ